jgi:phosphate transport system substrate-binding protein
MDRLMLGGRFDTAIQQVPDTGMGRGNNRALDEIADAVANDPDAIGYAGFANSRPSTKTLALGETNSGPYFDGTRVEVAKRQYPLTRTIFVYARKDSKAGPNPAATEFINFILSREGQMAVENDPAGFLPLPASYAASQRALLK